MLKIKDAISGAPGSKHKIAVDDKESQASCCRGWGKNKIDCAAWKLHPQSGIELCWRNEFSFVHINLYFLTLAILN